MTEYEYKVVELKGIQDEDEQHLDIVGKQGWELVTVIPPPSIASGGVPKRVIYLGYLKRPLACD